MDRSAEVRTVGFNTQNMSRLEMVFQSSSLGECWNVVGLEPVFKGFTTDGGWGRGYFILHMVVSNNGTINHPFNQGRTYGV